MQWNKLGYDIIWYEKNSSSCSPQMCQFRSVILRESGRVGSGQVRSRCLQSYHTRNVLVGKLFAKINTSEVSSTRFPKISWIESLKSFLRHVTFHALPLYTETTKVTVVFSRCLVLLWQSHWIPTWPGVPPCPYCERYNVRVRTCMDTFRQSSDKSGTVRLCRDSSPLKEGF